MTRNNLSIILISLPNASTFWVLWKYLVTMLPKDLFEVGQIISDDAVELNGGARLIMFLLDLMPFFVH